MEVHSVAGQSITAQIEELKKVSAKRKLPRPFEDPIREFSRASRVEGTVRNWLTLSIEARKKYITDQFDFFPKKDNETDMEFRLRQLERLRALWVIFQEESRAFNGIDANPDNSSPEVAIAALKKAFPGHFKKGT